MTPDQIAAELIGRNLARLKPTNRSRCWQTIELAAADEIRHWGNLYVQSNGTISYGPSLRGSREVSPQFRAMITGEER